MSVKIGSSLSSVCTAPSPFQFNRTPEHSYKSNPLRSISWRNGKRSTKTVATVHYVGKVTSLKCRALTSGGAPLVSKQKVFKILAFKSSSQNDSGCTRFNAMDKSVNKLSYGAHGSEVTSVESFRAQNHPVSYTSEIVERTIDDTLAIQKPLKHWLSILRTTPSSDQAISETVEEQSSTQAVETQKLVQQKTERRSTLQAVWSYFISLDATIKINLLIFIPFCVAVTSAYGAEISKELMPLWIFGPFIMSLYIKMIQAISALYVFCFAQTVKVVKNLPTYYLLAHDYIRHGKLKEEMRVRLLQPVVSIKNTDYRKVLRSWLNDMKVILAEKYIDFTESIWPFYCRMIRLLKRANLI
ncbi:unnamed protein product [Cuscuta epithymum]|uniref:Uncharacterized protein n=1 Tax=Cuscuta epithymum TaxID=186058 RepID=A0AAV0D789_9ASTE|nr:unnamed protein product [Cuscuta epithymum]